jgi:ABC-type transport system involved in multi-copper enzyme maturation permease subunit
MWLAWRQLRANALIATLAAVAAIGVLALTRAHVAALAGTDQLSTPYESLRLLGTGLIGVPAFIGAFWGAPLVAREIETGTHRLAWMQSVTRSRWLAARLTVAAVVAVVLTAACSIAFTWWSLPFDRLGNRVGTANFGQRGIAPIAYALFALALGTLAGAVLRRTLPAMVATLVGFMVVRFAFQWVVRGHLVGPVTADLPIGAFGPREGVNGWVLSSHTVDAAGRTIGNGQIDRLLADACNLGRDDGSEAFARCAHRLGIHDVVTWHPDAHFWSLQLAESAAFLLFAGALALACVWWLRHRTA